MALQPCRSALARSRHMLRSTPSLRAYYSAEASAAAPNATTPPTTSSSSPSSTSSATPSPSSDRDGPLPRWMETPAGMKAPIQMDFAKNQKNKVWVTNSDPQVLDAMYNKLLGPGGSKMLPEEVKWLAVTHKSFDQGRRGFNDRLALLGRSILQMEATKFIISKPPMEGSQVTDGFSHKRQPFQHSQLASVENLNVQGPKTVAGKEALFELAQRVGLLKVLRWKPRLVDSLQSSGVETVLNGAILAIIGAITLQHGAAVAAKVVRQRILATGEA